MKLLILGATGPTGLELVRLAVRAGHETTAIVRDRAKIGTRSRRRLVSENFTRGRRRFYADRGRKETVEAADGNHYII